MIPHLATHGLEQRVAGRDPFETGIGVERAAVKTNAVVTAGQSRQPPILGAALVVEPGGNFADGESALEVLDRREWQAGFVSANLEEAGDSLRHDAPLLRHSAAFDEHRQVQAFLGQTFKRRLANLAEVVFAHFDFKPGFYIVSTHFARVEFAEETLDLIRGQDFAHDVEHSVIVQGIAHDFIFATR